MPIEKGKRKMGGGGALVTKGKRKKTDYRERGQGPDTGAQMRRD